MSLQNIADRVGYKDASGAYRAIRAALKKTLQEPADDLRVLELDRLDVLLTGLWPKAINGDAPAVDRVLKIMERRASLLGLDAPRKVEQRIDLNIQEVAAEVASEFGVPVEAVIAEAERVIHEARR